MPTLFVALASVLMACWLALAILGPRRIDTAGAIAVLRYSMVIRLLALLVALTPLLLFVFLLWRIDYWQSQAKFNLGGYAFLTLSAMMGLWLIEVARVQIVLTDEGITRSSPWSGLAMLSWSDVASVRYSTMNRWFIVEGAGHTIRVSRYLSGIGVFAEVVQQKVVADRWKAAARALSAVR